MYRWMDGSLSLYLPEARAVSTGADLGSPPPPPPDIEAQFERFVKIALNRPLLL